MKPVCVLSCFYVIKKMIFYENVSSKINDKIIDRHFREFQAMEPQFSLFSTPFFTFSCQLALFSSQGPQYLLSLRPMR